MHTFVEAADILSRCSCGKKYKNAIKVLMFGSKLDGDRARKVIFRAPDIETADALNGILESIPKKEGK